MLYDSQIRYIELLQEDKKIGSAGFLKWECRGNLLYLKIHISGLPYSTYGDFKVRFGFHGKALEIGKIEVVGGEGELEERGLPLDLFLGEKVETYQDGRRISGAILEVLLPEGKRLALSGCGKTAESKAATITEASSQTWDPKAERSPESESETKQNPKAERNPEAEPETNPERKPEAKQEMYLGQVSESAPNLWEEDKNERISEEAGDIWKSSETEGETKEERKEAEECSEKTEMVNKSSFGSIGALQPNKWEQLRAIYPVMAPFGDNREYLRISPGDFVILKDRSYRLANNSFLLHGYFNYKHLILHRVCVKGEAKYYVGVPGNFYDKEKEVAILFGFESFECETEPAREGDYGYYMMRVEL